MQFVMMLTWILAHWEEYHTGIMVYGNGLFGAAARCCPRPTHTQIS